MKKIVWRIVNIMLVFAIGAWAFASTSGPAQETAVRERAVFAAAYAQNPPEPGVPSGSEFTVEPVAVDLSLVEYEPVPSMYDRWLAGELDLDENEYRVGPAEFREMQEAAMNMPPGVVPEGVEIFDDTGADASAPEMNALTLLSGFTALDRTNCCSSGASVPPDSDLAAGPSHLIAVENSAFIIYNKAGAVLAGPTLFDNFLSSLGASGTFDPTVLYDDEVGRFVMGIEDGANFFLMVTQSADPTGLWWIYKFDARFYGNEFFDYPHIGIGDHAIFMGANMFNGSVPGGFEGRIYAMDKNAAYAGGVMNVRTFSTGIDGGTPQPLNLTGFTQKHVQVPFNTHYFITDPYNGTNAHLWAWPNALGAGVPVIVQSYTMIAGGPPLTVSQLGSANQIQANDWRFRSFEYRNGYAYVADSVSFNSGDGTRNWARTARINLAAAGFPMSNQVLYGGGAGLHFTFPDITANMCDDTAVGYGRGGASIYHGMGVLGKDHTGAAPNFINVKDGETSYSSFDTPPYRWGDYSGMAIDPNGKTFWFMGEYAKNGISSPNYGNYIASFNFPDCTLRTFMDVAPNASGFAHIESIYAAGITGGCTTNPLKYCPGNTVTRGQMAVFILRGKYGGGYTPPAVGGSTGFADVPISHPFAAWIKQLAAENITGGCGGGNYCPNSPVTRAQMAIFLLRGKYGGAYTPPAVGGTTGFADVPTTHSAAAWIKQFAAEGITGGCGGGNYCPNTSVTRAQMAIFLQRTFSLPLP
jgi:hypothetical protein